MTAFLRDIPGAPCGPMECAHTGDGNAPQGAARNQ